MGTPDSHSVRIVEQRDDRIESQGFPTGSMEHEFYSAMAASAEQSILVPSKRIAPMMA